MRFKLSVWYSSLLLVFGLAFVLALNIAWRLDRPGSDVQLYELESYSGIEWQPVRQQPGGVITGFQPVVTPQYVIRNTEEQIYDQNVARLRNWSLIAVVGLALASGVGGYVISGLMLRPVRDITHVASEITATNLSRRINHQGPEDELKQLADTFDSMIDRLQTSFDRQRQFIQDASHELRTPLAAIRMNIEVAEMDPDVSPQEYRQLLETVKTQTERLTRLSEDLLLLSTAERDGMQTEAVEAMVCVREAAAQLTGLAAAKGTLIHTSGEDLVVLAHPDLLYRCVSNLVDNAIKYSSEHARVDVHVRKDGPEHVAIDVTDNGPGIPAEEAARVFDRFYRVDNGRSRRDGGTGLGLAIVREMVQDMGGSVTLNSEVGRGSTFTIRLKQTDVFDDGDGLAIPRLTADAEGVLA